MFHGSGLTLSEGFWACSGNLTMRFPPLLWTQREKPGCSGDQKEIIRCAGESLKGLTPICTDLKSDQRQ
jgi:hypothetical protein